MLKYYMIGGSIFLSKKHKDMVTVFETLKTEFFGRELLALCDKTSEIIMLTEGKIHLDSVSEILVYCPLVIVPVTLGH